MRTVAILFVCLTVSSSAWSADHRWTTGFGQGTFEAVVENDHKASVNIYCPSGQADTTPGFLIQGVKVEPRVHETIDVQFVVDGKNYPFSLDEIQFEARGQYKINAIHALIEALAKSRSRTFVVEFPKNGMSEKFSLLGAKAALKSAKDFLDGCE